MKPINKGGCRPQYIPRDKYLRTAKDYAVRGTRCYNAVMNEDKVRAIRSRGNGVSAKVWAKLFGCHYRTIEKIQYYETWTHVED